MPLSSIQQPDKVTKVAEGCGAGMHREGRVCVPNRCGAGLRWVAAVAYASPPRLAQQLRQLGDVERDPPRLVVLRRGVCLDYTWQERIGITEQSGT